MKHHGIKNIITCVLLFALLAALLCGCGSNDGATGTDGASTKSSAAGTETVDEDQEEQLSGGWTNELTEDIPDEALDAFDQAYDAYEEDIYIEPEAYAGSQIVAGTNYKFLCKIIQEADGEPTEAYVIVYKDLQGNCSITGFEDADGNEVDLSTSNYLGGDLILESGPAIKQTTGAEGIGEEPDSATETVRDDVLYEDGVYTSKLDVASYIHNYNKLPKNFITKKEAEKLGWQGGGLDDFIEDGCIGGTYFGNYEGLLPEKEGREYHECDIDTLHQDKRGTKRLVYSNDGLIYYTEDHYESFELLYGEE